MFSVTSNDLRVCKTLLFIAVCLGVSGRLVSGAHDQSIIGWGIQRFGADMNEVHTAISCGADHCLALKTDGSIATWGDNEYRQAIVPEPNTGFIAVAGGFDHSYALKQDGSIVAWGCNGANALGQCTVPPPNSGFTAIAKSPGDFSLGLRSDGSIAAWGLNDLGQINVPAPNSDFVAIGAGTWHGLGVKTNGSIVAWGNNGDGQLNVPPLNTNFIAVDGGAWHSIGLKSTGAIVAWGANNYGQTSVPAPNSGFVAIASGGFHNLGLKADGSIIAWGLNDFGQTSVPLPNSGFIAISAGQNHSVGLKADGTLVVWGLNFLSQSNVPAPNADFTAVAGGMGGQFFLGLRADGSIAAWGYNGEGQTTVPAPNTSYTAIGAGEFHAIALKTNGTIRAWGGLNNLGQLDIPAPNADFTAIAAGFNHNLGLKSDGSIVAWGNNANGQIDVPEPNSDFTAVAAGGFHSLGLKSDGSIAGWGSNNWGAISVPFPNSDFVAISAGYRFSLGLKTDGSIVGWGRNLEGQLDVPFPNSDFAAVAAGADHSLGLKSDGSIVAWGYNFWGQTDVPAPNSGFVAIAGDSRLGLAIRTEPPDCDDNGIPDDCEFACGSPGGPCDLPGCGAGGDCNSNTIPDACDLADCAGDPACDDCNLNGVPDSCDIASVFSLDVNPVDGVPDECAKFISTCTSPDRDKWSCPENWAVLPPGTYPDDVASAAGVYVQLVAPADAFLDVDATIPGALIKKEAKLRVTQVGAGNLTFTPSAAASASTVAGPLTPPPKLKLGVAGTLQLANDRAVTLSANALGVAPGGVILKQPGAGATSATITAAHIVVEGATCESLVSGGEITFEDTMSLTSTGKLIVDGSLSVCPRTCSSALQLLGPLTPPPKLRIGGGAIGNVGGTLSMIGAADVIVDTAEPLLLGGDFDNQSLVPSLFDWTGGKLTLDGTSPQLFEVAGINLGSSEDGYFTDTDALFDECPHTNYSMGTLEIAAGANVTFVNTMVNTAAVGCAEALYVRDLIFQIGSTVAIDNCKVYYDTLTDNGIVPTLIGCGALLATAPPPEIIWDGDSVSSDRTTRSLRFRIQAPAVASGSPGQNAIKVTMIDLQNPVPANLPQFPPPDFSAYEAGGTCTDPAGCARWVGRPGTFYESQGPPLTGPYRAARLQCTPFYWDWIAETATDPIVVVGAEIVPSSEYSVQTYASTCKGVEGSCSNVSTAVTMYTRRSGDVDSEYNPPSATNQPNAIDVAQLVNKFKNAAGSPNHFRAQLQPNLPELNASINALDIVAVVDSVKGFAYAFSGPCPCPSTVTCGGSCTGCPGMCVKTCIGGDNDGEPCINSNHCPSGACAAAGTCRDNCGRCTP